MRKDTNIVAVIFEEVNNLLNAIDKKIIDQNQKLEDIVTKADLAKDKTAFENAFLQTSRNLSVLDQKLNQISVSIHESENQIHSGLKNISSILKGQEKERIARHNQVLKLKSKRVITGFAVLFLLFSGSLAWNIYQRKKMMHLSENDLKYRYIKMFDGINSENLHKLEDIFYDNKKLINEIRKRVEHYERKYRKEQKKSNQPNKK